ncbi:hypothetical protein [Elizabethkingia anophelis]|uniref:Uncharacterized protein n=1 Tax=Elizabethkingia anophelis TaxID=1117645 RepID=A0A494JBS5_9FLAO|nr:hypothetical protein [Elizabethkingia anophelis]AQX52405.1 hypothetical protein AYC66_17745 [Elizabethkingia anophelis]MCT3642331.1 hypothetical protein [Elizabethkingia anophelis]MDV2459905.1 hypothetical protein [Elizabethkingia anophelis]MDV3554575.1 hypothetical protein [Elizabethkingia anophelis]MDV3630480.1 hypothetical protein [Elizabethkingia anophelis]
MIPVLNTISVISAFVFGVGVLYWIMDATVGKIKFFHSHFEWNGMQIKDFIFLAISIFVILSFLDFYKPY